jgi:hypothetical protein
MSRHSALQSHSPVSQHSLLAVIIYVLGYLLPKICKHSSIVNTAGNFFFTFGWEFKFKTFLLFYLLVVKQQGIYHTMTDDADNPRSIMDASI